VIIAAGAYTGGPAYANGVTNNIFYGNTGYGFDAGVTGGDQSFRWTLNNNNAYGSNSTAARHNLAAGRVM